MAATILSAISLGYADLAMAQQTAATDEKALEEVVITGSRIVRRDLQAASPIVTVGSESFEESSTLAVESVLNQLPQFVPSNTQFNTSDVFPSATSTPGISTVNMRGLGSNRTLVLIDGRRGQPVNSTLVIDTNSIPSSALESVEIISGGASATYGADALGGVTNFKLRDKFEGMDLQFRTGVTEQGDGEENRISLLLGSGLDNGRGNAMLGVEWTERGEVLGIDRDFYVDALKDSNTNAGTNGRMNGFAYEPGTNRPSQAATNALFPERPAGYNVPISTNFLFNDNNTLYKQERQGLGFNGDIINDPNYKIRPDGTLIQNNLDFRYSSPMERFSMFGKANFEITDNLETYTVMNFVSTTNSQVLQPSGAVGGFGASIPYGSGLYGPSRAANGSTLPEYVAGGAYGLNCPTMGGCTNSQAFPVPTELDALLSSRGADVTSNATTAITYDPITGAPVVISGTNSPWRIGGTFNNLPPRTIDNATNLFQITAGLRGSLPFNDWTWDAYVSSGQTRVDLDYIGFMSTSRWQRIVQAPNFGRGANITGAGSARATCTTGLVAKDLSQDCKNAISASYTDRTRLSQDVIEATAQGAIFDLPAGELRGAVGAVYRENDFAYMPDASRESNSIIDIPVGAFAQANVLGQTRVREAFAELLVPVISDMFLVQNLELELGYRTSDYGNTGGRVPTYKALFSWQPIDLVRFRGGYQLANRAPNINELFLDASSQAVTMRGPDYCRADTRETTGNHPSNPNRAAAQALCAALIGNNTSEFSADPNNYVGGRADGVILQNSSGNRNLLSEEGETFTFGGVFNSPFSAAWIADTTLSVDWYRAEIKDAIATVGAQTSYDLCFNRDGQSNPTYAVDDPNGVCANIVRDERSGAAAVVNSQFQNLGLIETSGVDANLNWRAGFDDMGLESIPGSLSLNISASKLFEFKAQEFPTATPLENKGTLARGGMFDWRMVTTLRYSHSNWDMGLNWRYLPAVDNSLAVTDPTTTTQGAGEYSIFNLTGNWNVTDTIGISGGVDNLFDTQPERIGAGQVQTIAAVNGGGTTVLNGSGSTSAGFYDVLGRRYFVNLKFRF
ncbi:MAG: TonB-dependent receptor [Pseudomonadota bacterium]